MRAAERNGLVGCECGNGAGSQLNDVGCLQGHDVAARQGRHDGAAEPGGLRGREGGNLISTQRTDLQATQGIQAGGTEQRKVLRL